MDCRQKGSLHRRASYVFQSVLHTTDEQKRIWTANWPRNQEAQLVECCDRSLLANISPLDLKGILRPLEEKLAHGVLNLWHCKVEYDRSIKAVALRRQLTPLLVSPMEAPECQPAQNSTPSTLGSTTEVACLSKKIRRQIEFL